MTDSAVAVKSKGEAEAQAKKVAGQMHSLEKQFSEMERANQKLMEEALLHAKQL